MLETTIKKAYLKETAAQEFPEAHRFERKS
jgi:hypothetical protein